MNSLSQQWRLWGVGVLLMLLVGVILIPLEKQNESKPVLKQLSYLPDGEYLRLGSLGYHALAADLLWLKAIQVMGEKQLSEEDGRWLYSLLDRVTTLDPQFVRAYQAGGLALCTLVVLPEESNQLLGKGIRHNPQAWELPFLLGFNYYYEFSDDAKAAQYMAQAARLPGSPETLAGLAAKLFVSGKSPQQAVDLLAALYTQTTDSNVRQLLETRLKEAVVERDLQILEQVIQQYHAMYSHRPRQLEDLITAGLLRSFPQEPFGGRYLYDPQTGVVKSSELKERVRVYGSRRVRQQSPTP